jgi:hypothetical protein
VETFSGHTVIPVICFIFETRQRILTYFGILYSVSITSVQYNVYLAAQIKNRTQEQLILYLISTHTNQLTTQLLWQREGTYTQRCIHNKTDNNTTSTSLPTAQITRIIPTPQRECCENKSKMRDTHTNIF